MVNESVNIKDKNRENCICDSIVEKKTNENQVVEDFAIIQYCMKNSFLPLGI